MKRFIILLFLLFCVFNLQFIFPFQPINPINAQLSACPTKAAGDANCDTAVTLADYQIWRGEYLGGCSAASPLSCGADEDGDGNPMDANFDETATAPSNTTIAIADFQAWRNGYFADNGRITITPPTMTPSPPPSAGTGIWADINQLQTYPITGQNGCTQGTRCQQAWDALAQTARSAKAPGADISNQDSTHDTDTLAAAIYCVRTAEPQVCEAAKNAVVGAIDTENGGRWLAVGRNLGSYIISADLLNLRAGTDDPRGGEVEAWLRRFQTKTLAHNNSGNQITFRQSAWASGSNASAQEGFAYAALSAYLKDQDGLSWSWNAFRRYAGDRTSPHTISSNDDSWQEIPSDPVGIQNAGAVKNGCRLDGAISNDMSRGAAFSCNPAHTPYPWVGLEGAVPAALILQRAGYPAFEQSDKAILRAFDYLWHLRQTTGNADWFDGQRANELIYLINRQYNKSFTIVYPTGGGRTVGYTDWTHP